MKTLFRIALLLAFAATPAFAQSKAQLDSVRTELVRSRAFIRGAETQLTKTLTLLDSLIAKADTTTPPAPVDTTTPPPPPPPPPVVITDTTVRIYEQHDFSGSTLGLFRTVPTPPNTPCNFNGEAGRCSDAIWLRNGRVEILYQRLDTLARTDINKAITWIPKDTSQYTKWGQTLYIAATWTFPSYSPATRAMLDSAAIRMGLPAPTDADHEGALRKGVYINDGRPNHAVLSIHDYTLKYSPVAKSENGVCLATGSQVYNLYRFTATELMDQKLRIELEVRRSSGVMVADGEFKVWLNGRLIRHQTQVCTNRDSNLSWRMDIGQQYQGKLLRKALFSELRTIDDVVVANKRPQ